MVFDHSNQNNKHTFKSFHSSSSSRVFIDADGRKHHVESKSESLPNDPTKIKVIKKNTLYKANSNDIEHTTIEENIIDAKTRVPIDLFEKKIADEDDTRNVELKDERVSGSSIIEEEIMRGIVPFFKRFSDQLVSSYKNSSEVTNLQMFDNWRRKATFKEKQLINQCLAERLEEHNEQLKTSYIDDYVKSNLNNKELKQRFTNLKEYTQVARNIENKNWWYDSNVEDDEIDLDSYGVDMYKNMVGHFMKDFFGGETVDKLFESYVGKNVDDDFKNSIEQIFKGFVEGEKDRKDRIKKE